MNYTEAVTLARTGSQQEFGFLFQSAYKSKYYLALQYMKGEEAAKDGLQKIESSGTKMRVAGSLTNQTDTDWDEADLVFTFVDSEHNPVETGGIVPSCGRIQQACPVCVYIATVSNTNLDMRGGCCMCENYHGNCREHVLKYPQSIMFLAVFFYSIRLLAVSYTTSKI